MMRNRSRMRGAATLHTSTAAPCGDHVSLSALRPGETGVVVELAAGRGLLGRMTSLGFTPGAEVAVVQNYGRGPLIARVRGARIALGRGEAGGVKVRRRSTQN